VIVRQNNAKKKNELPIGVAENLNWRHKNNESKPVYELRSGAATSLILNRFEDCA